jgi:hypothetical protein
VTGEGQGGGGELSPEECIRAGMYWFGRSDFDAARAWWERAIEIDPQSRRALECLRLLERTATGTNLSADIPSPFVASSGKAQAAPISDPWTNPTGPHPTMSKTPTGPHAAQAKKPSSSNAAPRKDPTGPHASQPRKDPTGPQPSQRKDPTGPFASIPKVAQDPFDFAADGQRFQSAVKTPLGLHEVKPLNTPAMPWDEGPSRTSVVNVGEGQAGFDAVAEATPLPELDRGRFFGRGDPTSRQEIYDFLRATGDLPTEPGVRDDPPADSGIVFDEPVDMTSTQPLARPAQVDHLAAARDRYQLHDFDGAIELLDQIPPENPGFEEARNLAAEARAQLLKMYESKVGNFQLVPKVLVTSEEMIWLNLNHRAGFILSQIDGQVSYDDIVSLSGMPRLDTVRILADLIRDRVIGG